MYSFLSMEHYAGAMSTHLKCTHLIWPGQETLPKCGHFFKPFKVNIFFIWQCTMLQITMWQKKSKFVRACAGGQFFSKKNHKLKKYYFTTSRHFFINRSWIQQNYFGWSLEHCGIFFLLTVLIYIATTEMVANLIWAPRSNK